MKVKNERIMNKEGQRREMKDDRKEEQVGPNCIDDKSINYVCVWSGQIFWILDQTFKSFFPLKKTCSFC